MIKILYETFKKVNITLELDEYNLNLKINTIPTDVAK